MAIAKMISLIESFMKAVGGSAREWRVGLAQDGEGKLKSLGKTVGTNAEVWRLDDQRSAIAILAYLLQTGCQLDGNEGGATQLYAFRDRPTSFREFLERRSKEVNAKEREDTKTEWVNSVDRLVKQLKAWVEEWNPGVLSIQDETHNLSEEGLGRYSARGLSIALEDTEVHILPVARRVVGLVGRRGHEGVRPQGRVDVTNGVQTYGLLRIVEREGETWFVLDEHGMPSVLSKESFEAMLTELFL